jgi:hypothetical protein
MKPKSEPVPFLWPLVFALLCWLVVAFMLTSCGVPVKATYQGEYGAYSYSSKGGFEIKIHATK